MISSLQGTAASVGDDSLVIVVGGVGFSVAVTPQVARATHVGAEVHLHTNLIVREDALSLYGFENRDYASYILLEDEFVCFTHWDETDEIEYGLSRTAIQPPDWKDDPARPFEYLGTY